MCEDTPQPLKLTLEDGRRALAVHVLAKGERLRQKYGPFIDRATLDRILQDPEFTRYPTRIVFDSSRIEKGLFAQTKAICDNKDEGYIIYVHEHFRGREGDLAALVLYQLVQVNYGDFASGNEAEEFASSALGMGKEDYYQTICRLADSITEDHHV